MVVDVLFSGVMMGLARSLHGAGVICRMCAYAFYIIVIYSILCPNPVYAILLYILIVLSFIPGWGKYFSAFGDTCMVRSEVEIPIIDIYIDRIENDQLAGIVGMSLRWFIFMFPSIAITSGPEYSFLMLLVGPIYGLYKYLGYKFFPIEFLSGFLLGTVLLL